jgi:hypothetical protein
MANVEIKFDVNELTESTVRKSIEAGLFKASLRVKETAADYAPLKDGLLEKSFENEVEGNEAIVFTNVAYAPDVEYKQGAQARIKGRIPFFRPALFDNKDNIVKDVKSELDKNL